MRLLPPLDDNLKMQQPTHPLAYLITFHTFGTWLPGSDGEWVDDQHNEFDTPRLAKSVRLRERAEDMLSSGVFTLDTPCRRVVKRAIEEACTFKGWGLHEVHIRTTHVHVVVRAPLPPERVMNTLKARATRLLREAELATAQERIWVRHGSTRYLWYRKDVEAAIRYVRDAQGAPLP